MLRHKTCSVSVCPSTVLPSWILWARSHTFNSCLQGLACWLSSAAHDSNAPSAFIFGPIPCSLMSSTELASTSCSSLETSLLLSSSLLISEKSRGCSMRVRALAWSFIDWPPSYQFYPFESWLRPPSLPWLPAVPKTVLRLLMLSFLTPSRFLPCCFVAVASTGSNPVSGLCTLTLLQNASSRFARAVLATSQSGPEA